MPLSRVAAAALFLLGCAGAAQADRHALLIGVANYPGLVDMDLEAPVNDVVALRDLLVRNWQFPPANIEVLLDQQASKQAILAALDRLVKRVRPGDQAFLFYSGHGTSAYNPRLDLGLPLNTGALLPVDVKKGRPQDVAKQLIVGSVDIRPRLLELDRKADTLVIFDACYSGESVKSLSSGMLRARDVPFRALLAPRSPEYDFDVAYTEVELPEVDSAYPYERVVFVSASAKSERAWEIKSEAIRRGILRTVDGKPHGILTNALLRGLQGSEADGNRDGQVTYEEIHQFIKRESMSQQAPQLLPEKRSDVTSKPLFSSRAPRVPLPKRPAASDNVVVNLSPGASGLTARLERVPAVRIVTDGAADLSVTALDAGYELFIANGVRIGVWPRSDETGLIERIRRETDVRRLRDFAFAQQTMNVGITASPSNRDAYAVTERVRFQMTAEAASYFLLLNIDVSGVVSVVHAGSAPSRAAEVSSCICRPVGTEYMKLFAFREPLSSKWEGLYTPGGSGFRRLMEFLEGAKGSQATLLTYSSDRQRPQGETCPLQVCQ